MIPKRAKLIVILLAVALAACTSAPKVDVAAEKAAIEGVVHVSIGWAKVSGGAAGVTAVGAGSAY